MDIYIVIIHPHFMNGFHDFRYTVEYNINTLFKTEQYIYSVQSVSELSQPELLKQIIDHHNNISGY